VVTFHDSPSAEKIAGVHGLTRDGGLGDLWTYVIGYPAWSFTFKRELRDSTVSVAVSRSLKSDLLREMGQEYVHKMRTIYNGIDLPQLDAKYDSAGDGRKEQNHTILFAGRLFWRKGIPELVRMAALSRKEGLDFKFIVHGRGPLFGKICEDKARLGLTNMEIKGFTDDTELMRSMRESSFAVLPSSYEACPMIILEGMCLGKIPILFDLPYAREITENGRFGILARTADDAIKKVVALTRNGDIKELKEEIQAYARTRFDGRRTALQYVRLYEQILNDGLGQLPHPALGHAII
jgi:glycosyltransferase involved in cell wall biosynthesis